MGRGCGRSVRRGHLTDHRSHYGPSGVAILNNAQANGVRIDIVQPMVFDYYDRVTNISMGQSAINAVTGLHGQLATLFGSSKTSAQLWAMEGATIMNGLDDYPKKTESTSVADAQQLLAFAQSNGMTVLSMWATERDNGGCLGLTGANNCSGWSRTRGLHVRLSHPGHGTD